MAVKDAIYQVDNGSGFDEIHLKTKAAQVVCADGKTVEASLADKANKAQEAWIKPTLLYGWINALGGANEASFFKDEFGIVHLRGNIKGGGSDSCCMVLPVGYRPYNINYFPVSSSQNASAYVRSDGWVVIFTPGTYISLNGISFRAEL